MAMGERHGGMGGIRKVFLAKTVSFRWKKKMNSTVFAQTRCVLSWLGTSQLALQLTLSSSSLALRDPYRFNVHPLHPGLEEQLSTAPVPQNTHQKVCSNFPKDIMRISPFSTMVMLPLLQPDVLGVCHRRSPGLITWVMSIGRSRSDFPGRIRAAGFLPFLKIQMKLCFSL